MNGAEQTTVIFVVLAVVLFMLLGIAILVIVDHKAQIPDHFHSDPFSIRGLRRDHPVISFLTATILACIILALVGELAVTLGERFHLFETKEEPRLLELLKEQRVTEKQRHFHHELKVDLPNLGRKPVCFYCHGDYPHSKERMVRTLLNMHTQFVGCMTCHTDPRRIEEGSLRFSWLNYSGIPVEGPPYGTALDPDSGFLVETDDYYSKIVVYQGSVAEENLLEIPETRPEAREFLEVRARLSDRDREAVKKAFHRLVSPKGRFCTRCHTHEEESYLPFRELGFSNQRVADLTNLNIIGIVQKYRRFYMPNLLHSDVALPRVESLIGSGGKGETEVEEMGDDPRAWWRRTFDSPRPAPEE